MSALLFLLLFAGSCATLQVKKPVSEPEIHEISSIKELENWIVPDTLVLFDLDNTLFESTDMVGHANWFNDMLKKYPDRQDEILKRSWGAIDRTDVRLIEEIAPKVIANLQKRGVSVMALTSRNLILLDATLRQVKSVGIDFSKTSHFEDSAYYHEGILFAHNNYPKGQALLNYLKDISFKPKRIILVDDLKKNLEDVCSVTGAIGLYYPIVDHKRHLEWDEKEAERRWLSP
ncbi:MAG: DUF2608 domain-containing protein [Myxococcaceae bacterium]|nr:DUF2608 domain-containing protein [Myxococcaceae bacterium]